MGLDFHGSLFKTSGLQQDSGLLSERWGQGGSNIINDYTDNANDETLYTVTAGKTLYIKQITFFEQEGNASWGRIQDGGTVLFEGGLSADQTLTFVFEVPLKFSTSVYLNAKLANRIDVSFSGWEE